MAIDPVCRMTIASLHRCRARDLRRRTSLLLLGGLPRRFLANPAAYAKTVAAPAIGGSHQCCSVTGGHDRPAIEPAGARRGSRRGLAGERRHIELLLRGADPGVGVAIHRSHSSSSGGPTSRRSRRDTAFRSACSSISAARCTQQHRGKVMVATGTTSGAAMVSCCTHYLVNLLPVLGATGLVSFVGRISGSSCSGSASHRTWPALPILAEASSLLHMEYEAWNATSCGLCVSCCSQLWSVRR